MCLLAAESASLLQGIHTHVEQLRESTRDRAPMSSVFLAGLDEHQLVSFMVPGPGLKSRTGVRDNKG